MLVEAPREQRTLFLGDLSIHCTEKDVQMLFKPFGSIESIKIKHGYTHQHHSVYGFIRFATLDSAVRAIECLQGAVLLGRPLRIAWAQRNASKRLFPKDPSEPFQTAQIHFSFISRQIEQIVSELTLRQLFGQFGEVLDVAIKKSSIDNFERVQHGYGFIHYPMSKEGILSALRAIKTIHQVTIGPVTYDSTLGISLKEIIDSDAELWEIWQGFRIPPAPAQPSAGSFPSVIPPTLPAHVVPAAAPAVTIQPPQLQPHFSPQLSVVPPGGAMPAGPRFEDHAPVPPGNPYVSAPNLSANPPLFSPDLTTYAPPPLQTYEPAPISSVPITPSVPSSTYSFPRGAPNTYQRPPDADRIASISQQSFAHPLPLNPSEAGLQPPPSSYPNIPRDGISFSTYSSTPAVYAPDLPQSTYNNEETSRAPDAH